jgi:hypothetical protein
MATPEKKHGPRGIEEAEKLLDRLATELALEVSKRKLAEEERDVANGMRSLIEDDMAIDRKQFWEDAFLAVIHKNIVTNITVAAELADVAVDQWDKHFNKK